MHPVVCPTNRFPAGHEPPTLQPLWVLVFIRGVVVHSSMASGSWKMTAGRGSFFSVRTFNLDFSMVWKCWKAGKNKKAKQSEIIWNCTRCHCTANSGANFILLIPFLLGQAKRFEYNGRKNLSGYYQNETMGDSQYPLSYAMEIWGSGSLARTLFSEVLPKWYVWMRF